MLNLDPYTSSESDDSSDSDESSSDSDDSSSGSDKSTTDSDENDDTESSKGKTGYTNKLKNATVRPPTKLAVRKNLYSNLPCSKMQKPDAVKTPKRAAENSSKVKDPNNDNCNDVESNCTLAIKKAKLETETKASTSLIPSVPQINSKSELINESDDDVVEVPYILKRSIYHNSKLTISEQIRRLVLLEKKPALKSPNIIGIRNDDDEEDEVVIVPLPLDRLLGRRSCPFLRCLPPPSSRFNIIQRIRRPQQLLVPEVKLVRIPTVSSFSKHSTAKRTIILPGRSFLESIEDFISPKKVEAINDDVDDDVVEVPMLSEYEKSLAAPTPSPFAFGQPNVKRTIILPGRSFLESIPDLEWPEVRKPKEKKNDF